ncbi:MerR family transcriptional regulator [Streptomyces aureus]
MKRSAGLPTRIIKRLLPCLGKPRSIQFQDATPQLLALLTGGRGKLSARIEVLIRNRDAMSEYLTEVEQHRAPAAGVRMGSV